MDAPLQWVGFDPVQLTTDNGGPILRLLPQIRKDGYASIRTYKEATTQIANSLLSLSLAAIIEDND
jgi:hypothetical protein